MNKTQSKSVIKKIVPRLSLFTYINYSPKLNQKSNENKIHNDILDSYIYKLTSKKAKKNYSFSLRKKSNKDPIVKTEPRQFKYKQINLDCNTLFRKISNCRSIFTSDKKNNNRVDSKNPFLKKFPIIDKNNNSKNKMKKNIKTDQVHNLQKLYYRLDATDKSKNDSKKVKTFTFSDYANKNVIYNHPQLYLINKHDNLPKLQNTHFIKFFNLTKRLPERNNDSIEKKEVEELINYKSMQKRQKSVFFTRYK